MKIKDILFVLKNINPALLIDIKLNKEKTKLLETNYNTINIVFDKKKSTILELLANINDMLGEKSKIGSITNDTEVYLDWQETGVYYLLEQIF